jgi:hypothetical protein
MFETELHSFNEEIHFPIYLLYKYCVLYLHIIYITAKYSSVRPSVRFIHFSPNCLSWKEMINTKYVSF